MSNHCHYYCCNCCGINKIVNDVKTITVTCNTNIPQPLEISGNISVDGVTVDIPQPLEVSGTISCETSIPQSLEVYGEQFQKPENVTVTDGTVTFTVNNRQL